MPLLDLTFSEDELGAQHRGIWSRTAWICTNSINAQSLIPEANSQHPRGKRMKKEWRKLESSDLQISCYIVLKTDQNQCTSFMTPNNP